jgi:ribulose-phosphate 3-epimerase
MGEGTCSRLAALSPALSVGVVSADLANLAADVALLERAGCRLLHFDVMDGHFAPQLTVGPAFAKAAKTSMLKDVHLMVDEPLAMLDDFAAAGADMITVHVESRGHMHRCLQRIAELKNVNDPQAGIARGVAINPSTPVSALEPLVDQADVVFLLAVNPGFGGQKFIEATARRVAEVRELAHRAGCSPLIGIDGGVTRTTIAAVAALRPDIVVAGSAVFEKREIEANLAAMANALNHPT